MNWRCCAPPLHERQIAEHVVAISCRVVEAVRVFDDLLQSAEPVEQQLLERRRRQRRGRVAFTKANETAFAGGEEEAAKPVRNKGPRIGRNDACPCGSGKKYKKCCGA